MKLFFIEFSYCFLNLLKKADLNLLCYRIVKSKYFLRTWLRKREKPFLRSKVMASIFQFFEIIFLVMIISRKEKEWTEEKDGVLKYLY